MGVLRITLAILVICFHSYLAMDIYTLNTVIIAVQVFFMISGFYMGFVLTTKYPFSRSGLKQFFRSRLQRIYPLYWLVLLATIVLSILYFSLLGHHNIVNLYLSDWQKLDLGQQILVIFSNLGLFGQDLTHFSTYGQSLSVSELLIVPQSWTLALELVFYLTAPFLNRLKTRYLVILIGLSIAIRFVFYSQGLHIDPWTHRFFPFEFAFFAAGMLASRIYLKYEAFFKRQDWVKWLTVIIVTGLTIGLYFMLRLDFNDEARKWFYYLLAFLSLPFLFAFDNYFKWDRAIGELSHPIYLTHLLVIVFIFRFIQARINLPFEQALLLLISMAVISAIGINKLMTRIEQRKQLKVPPSS